MSERGDCRKLHRAKYHEWLRRRWQQRAEQAVARRIAESRHQKKETQK